jgi:predicted nucleic acid-binding protein
MNYIADTNVYIRASADAVFREAFEGFIRDHGPLVVSSVVIAEVLLGVVDSSRHADAARAMVAGAAVSTPIAADWIRAGETVARLGAGAVTKSRSFWTDTLLAAQCARTGITLITQNEGDFRRLKRFIPVEAVSPFPR